MLDIEVRNRPLKNQVINHSFPERDCWEILAKPRYGHLQKSAIYLSGGITVFLCSYLWAVNDVELFEVLVHRLLDLIRIDGYILLDSHVKWPWIALACLTIASLILFFSSRRWGNVFGILSLLCLYFIVANDPSAGEWIGNISKAKDPISFKNARILIITSMTWSLMGILILHKGKYLFKLNLVFYDLGQTLDPIRTHQRVQRIVPEYFLAIKLVDPNSRSRLASLGDRIKAHKVFRLSVNHPIYPERIRRHALNSWWLTALFRAKLLAKEFVTRIRSQKNGCKSENQLNMHIKSIRLSKTERNTLLHGDDFWPLTKLVMASMLHKQTVGYPEQIQRNHRAWFSFVTHRNLVSLWFIVNSVIFGVVAISKMHDLMISDLQLPMLLSILPVAWVMYSIVWHKAAMTRWIFWAKEDPERPMGNLPLFSFEDGQWEEIPANEIPEFVVTFGIDSTSILNLAATLFLLVSLVLLQIIK